MLKRNEVAIAIAKTNRVTKVALKVNYDTNPGEYRGVIERDFGFLPLWAEDIKAYWKEHPTASLTDDILCLLSPGFLMTQYQNGLTVLERKHYQTLVSYNRIMTQLQIDCDRLVNNTGNDEFEGMPIELSNDEALRLLRIGADAGLIDPHFKPMYATTPQQLKVLAYGIASTLKLPKRRFWIPLEELWETNIGRVKLPQLRQAGIKKVMELFPDVDFEPLFASDDNLFFNCPYNRQRIKTMYKSLLVGGYISPETRESQMYGLFNLDKDTKPINWIQSVRLLSYFVFNTFSSNNFNIWAIATARFLVNGKKSNGGTLKSSMVGIRMVKGRKEYDSTLMDIAEAFNNRPKTSTS